MKVSLVQRGQNVILTVDEQTLSKRVTDAEQRKSMMEDLKKFAEKPSKTAFDKLNKQYFQVVAEKQKEVKEKVTKTKEKLAQVEEKIEEVKNDPTTSNVDKESRLELLAKLEAMNEEDKKFILEKLNSVKQKAKDPEPVTPMATPQKRERY